MVPGPLTTSMSSSVTPTGISPWTQSQGVILPLLLSLHCPSHLSHSSPCTVVFLCWPHLSVALQHTQEKPELSTMATKASPSSAASFPTAQPPGCLVPT